MSERTTYAVASDLSDIIATDDGFGKFATKLEALEYQIGRLESEKATIAEYLRAAKRRRAAIARATGAA